MIFAQTDHKIRCEWGLNGTRWLAPISDAVILVDVLSFSTSVSIAAGRGATVFPYAGSVEDLPGFAASVNAQVAGRRREGASSLSPASMTRLAPGTRLVLPSPNGSTLSLATGDTPTFAGCLRNSRAVAAAALAYGPQVAVIPGGERIRSRDGSGHTLSLRFALEDLLGAGSILFHLREGAGAVAALSPEAQAAATLYESMRAQVGALVAGCGSGLELIQKGYEEDVALAAEVDVDDWAPILRGGAYVSA
ncbi:MAG: 2-phosphosulfolactate phosphatase [Candidatus Promineifilaceae bacterium]|nr:2-phosphosulfolactate phosphatase [Candidatus Promineifilaceae bacterium]